MVDRIGQSHSPQFGTPHQPSLNTWQFMIQQAMVDLHNNNPNGAVEELNKLQNFIQTNNPFQPPTFTPTTGAILQNTVTDNINRLINDINQGPDPVSGYFTPAAALQSLQSIFNTPPTALQTLVLNLFTTAESNPNALPDQINHFIDALPPNMKNDLNDFISSMLNQVVVTHSLRTLADVYAIVGSL